MHIHEVVIAGQDKEGYQILDKVAGIFFNNYL